MAFTRIYGEKYKCLPLYVGNMVSKPTDDRRTEAGQTAADAYETATFYGQATEAEQAAINACEAIEDGDDETALKEADIAASLAGAAASKADPRLVVLRELFYRDNYEAETCGGALGDFSIDADDGHFGGKTFKTLGRMGYEVESVHTMDDGSSRLYVNDVRGAADANTEAGR